MFGISVYVDKQLRWTPNIRDENFKDFDYVELVFGSFDFNPKSIPESNMFSLKKVKSIHLPEIDFDDVKKSKDLIAIFADLGVSLFNLHLHSSKKTVSLDKRMAVLKELSDFAESIGVTITVENTAEDVDELRQLFKQAPKLKFCLDIGHANIRGGVNLSESFISAFGDRLALVHVHDNVGGTGEKNDKHLPLGEGKIDFVPIFKKLKSVGYAGPFTFELYKADYSKWKSSLEIGKRLLK